MDIGSWNNTIQGAGGCKETRPEDVKEKAKATTSYNHFVQMVTKWSLLRWSDWLTPSTKQCYLALFKPLLEMKEQHFWLNSGYTVQGKMKQAACFSIQCMIHTRILNVRSNVRCYSYFQCHQPLPALLWVVVWISCFQSAGWLQWVYRIHTSHQEESPRCP